MKKILIFGILLAYASIITTNVYILALAEIITIPTLIALFIKQQKSI